MNAEQRLLSPDQLAVFQHQGFVDDQVRHFAELYGDGEIDGVIVDVGGGAGYFARALTRRVGLPCRVVDTDPVSVDACLRSGVEARIGDALAPEFDGEEAVVCFNLILHHLVAADESATRKLQVAALAAWRGRVDELFVNEYIYDSWAGSSSGALIYRITNSQLLSAAARVMSRFSAAFSANTFGVGVRFRGRAEWEKLFHEAGWEVAGYRRGWEERLPLPQRVLLAISSIRRDSFRLRPRTG